MVRYENAEQATADGIRIESQPEASRFAILQGEGKTERLLGEAHYTLVGETGSSDAAIDFDHTVVLPELRGRGLAGLLAEYALTSGVTKARSIRASCSFIRNYLALHPELAEPAE